VENSERNASLVIEALREFGAPLLDITESDFVVPTTVYQMGLPPSRIGLLAGLAQMDFAECWERRKVAGTGELSINYISAEDLLLNKEMAGRPQDLIDAENLRKRLTKKD